MVDADGFDLTSAGERCTYDRAARPIASETGSKFNARRPLPKPVSAVKKFLTTHSIDAAMSLESEGIFVRMPPDDAEAFAGSGGRGDIRDESVILLAQAYFNAHPIMSDVKATTGCTPSVGHPDPYPSGLNYGSQLAGYAGTLLDFAYSELGTKMV